MQDIATKLNSFRYNIKAETVINNFLINGYSIDEIIIEFKTSHKRNWDNDILKCELKGGKLHFELSRDGLFDTLPEYLFLKPFDNQGINEREKQKIIKFNTQQRTNANILFNPIENAIFYKRVDIEQFENEIIFLLDSCCLESLSDFYKIDHGLDPIYLCKLVKLIPWLYMIVGDFPLTAKCLEYFLEQPVSYEITEVQKSMHPEGNLIQGGLGSDTCGDDMLVNGEFSEQVSTIKFLIGPVEIQEVKHYLPGGEKQIFINYFSNYFIPLEYDIALSIDVVNKGASFVLEDSFLGFNSSTN